MATARTDFGAEMQQVLGLFRGRERAVYGAVRDWFIYGADSLKHGAVRDWFVYGADFRGCFGADLGWVRGCFGADFWTAL